jgi:hypothetical protein
LRCAASSSTSFDPLDAAGGFRITKPFSNIPAGKKFVGKVPKQEAHLTGASSNCLFG